MQVILVLTDIKTKKGNKLTFSLFEKPQPGDKLDDNFYNSPSIQVGTMLSAFLKTIEAHGKLFFQYMLNEERLKDYDKTDFRHHIKSYDNVIEIDLSKFKPKTKPN